MTENEWKLFNQVLLDIYYPDSITDFGQKCLNLIKIFIPYHQGLFVVVNEDGSLNIDSSIFENIDNFYKEKYIREAFDEDYLINISYFSQSMAYKDSDLLADKKRVQTPFYKHFMKPQHLHYGCGLIIIHNTKPRVFLNLLRQLDENDITDNEMQILKTLLPHFEKNINAFLLKKLSSHNISNCFSLSEREIEIVSLVVNGYSNEEIGLQLSISPTTVKKHLSNIFSKTGITRRTQLLSLFSNLQQN